MSVYIDPLMSCLVSEVWKWSQACHMYADSLEELHTFARQIGLKRAWFQNKRVPHYDLNPSRRLAAIRQGAIEHNRQQAVDFWKAKGWFPKTLGGEET